MKKTTLILTILPFLVSCNSTPKTTYSEEIKASYPAYYYEATMEDFSKLHEKKDNYLRVLQSGYYESTQFSSENYNPDYFPEINEILKTSPGIKEQSYDLDTKKTFSYDMSIKYKDIKSGYYSGQISQFVVYAYESLGFFVINTEFGNDDDWFPLRKQAFYAFTGEQSEALKDFICGAEDKA